MKTNATPTTVINAVKKVSEEQFGGNVVFMNYPKRITKNVCRFTLRTKNVEGPGSMVTKAGQKQPKANWEVQAAVKDAILELMPYSNIYVDTIYGREFGKGEIASPDMIDASEASYNKTNEETDENNANSETPREKRKYTKRTPAAGSDTGKKRGRKPNPETKLIKALKHLMKHPELLEA